MLPCYPSTNPHFHPNTPSHLTHPPPPLTPLQENIDAALLALDTIVAGQRIKDVLAQMRSTCAHLKRPCWTAGGGVKVR